MNKASGLVVISLILAGCSSLGQPLVGISESGKLMPCPKAPHCVSSQAARQAQQVAPFWMRDDADDTWQAILDLIAAQPRTEIQNRMPQYVHAEVTSPWGVYTDDLELLRKLGSLRLDLRSSSRIGYYDFQVNRERVEKLREVLLQQGLIQTTTP